MEKIKIIKKKKTPQKKKIYICFTKMVVTSGLELKSLTTLLTSGLNFQPNYLCSKSVKNNSNSLEPKHTESHSAVTSMFLYQH